MARQSLVGGEFGRLTVLRRSRKLDPQGRGYWVCRCECGTVTVTRQDALKSGATKSCGCLQKETAKEVVKLAHKATTKHGMYQTPTYATWHSMKSRCNNPKVKEYKWYGGRDISICDRWVESFENFLVDMGERPEGTTLDRINGNEGYSKENCRWVDMQDQQSNRSSNRFVEINGSVFTYAQAGRHLGIHRRTVARRVIRGELNEVKNNV